IDLAHLGQTRTAHTLCSLETRAQAQEFRRVSESFRISSGRIVSNRDTSEEQRHLRIQWTKPDCLFSMFDRLAILSRKRQTVAEIGVGRRRTRIEVNRPTKRRDRFLSSPFH